MVIEIKDKEIELKFGMKFVRELDEKCQKTWGDAVADKFGLSVSLGVPLLMAGDATMLAEILYYGCNYMTSGRPKLTDIDDYIDDHEDIDGLYDEVISELKKSNACGRQARTAEKEMKGQTGMTN